MFGDMTKHQYISDVAPLPRRGEHDVLQPADPLIFLIDEDEVVRDSLKVLLESHGLQVRDFRHAADFLAKAGTPRAGCLVLGHNRSIAEGLQLLAALRGRGAALPTIFIVGGGDAVTKAAALAAGAVAYLERPIEEAALIRTVAAALARKCGLSASAGDASAPESLNASIGY
jgi:two-component system, LuxR family, response regulator FixJ